MTFDKNDIPFIVIILGMLFYLLVSNFTYYQEVKTELKRVEEYNHAILIRIIQIEQTQEKISVELDSLRSIYLRK
jgi:hypothetical protein